MTRHADKHVDKLIRGGGGAVGESVCPTSGRLGVESQNKQTNRKTVQFPSNKCLAILTWKDGIFAQRGFTLRQMREIWFYFLTIRVAVHIVVICTLDKFSNVSVV